MSKDTDSVRPMLDDIFDAGFVGKGLRMDGHASDKRKDIALILASAMESGEKEDGGRKDKSLDATSPAMSAADTSRGGAFVSSSRGGFAGLLRNRLSILKHPLFKKRRKGKTFNEEDHPRGEHGQFAEGGDSGGETAESPYDVWRKRDDARDETVSRIEDVANNVEFSPEKGDAAQERMQDAYDEEEYDQLSAASQEYVDAFVDHFAAGRVALVAEGATEADLKRYDRTSAKAGEAMDLAREKVDAALVETKAAKVAVDARENMTPEELPEPDDPVYPDEVPEPAYDGTPEENELAETEYDAEVARVEELVSDLDEKHEEVRSQWHAENERLADEFGEETERLEEVLTDARDRLSKKMDRLDAVVDAQHKRIYPIARKVADKLLDRIEKERENDPEPEEPDEPSHTSSFAGKCHTPDCQDDPEPPADGLDPDERERLELAADILLALFGEGAADIYTPLGGIRGKSFEPCRDDAGKFASCGEGGFSAKERADRQQARAVEADRMIGLARGGKLNAEEMGNLGDHLLTMTSNELRATAERNGLRLEKGKFAEAKADLVARMGQRIVRSSEDAQGRQAQAEADKAAYAARGAAATDSVNAATSRNPITDETVVKDERASGGWPKEAKLGELKELARRMLGASFHSVQVIYGSQGPYVVVNRVKSGYHGREVVPAANYNAPMTVSPDFGKIKEGQSGTVDGYPVSRDEYGYTLHTARKDVTSTDLKPLQAEIEVLKNRRELPVAPQTGPSERLAVGGAVTPPTAGVDVTALHAAADTVGQPTTPNSKVNAILDQVASLPKADAQALFERMGGRGKQKDPNQAAHDRIKARRESAVRLRLGGHPMTDSAASIAQMRSELATMTDEPLREGQSNSATHRKKNLDKPAS